MTTLVGLYSPYPQSGKTTFGKALAACEPTSRILKFADPGREVVIQFVAPFLEGGTREVEEWLNDERKDNKKIPGLNVTLRHLMQTLLSGWGRHMVHPDIWVKTMRLHLRQEMTAKTKLIVVDDLRMLNEYHMLFKEGAWLVRIDRKDRPQTPEHESNAALEEQAFDFHVMNEGMEDLHMKARLIARDLGL